jgi:MYXO-CTERM domain-containing protein
MSRGGRAVLFSAAWIGFAPACAEPPPGSAVGENQQAWVSGTSVTRGHEDITRFAAEFADQQLVSELGVANFFSRIPEGEPCVGTAISLLQGNCATDSPDDTMTSHYGVSASAWQTAPDLQVLHFLRNYVGATEVQGARQACEAALGAIVAASNLGAEAWAAGDTAGGEYWFGHALHIVQDSFAPPHTDRSGQPERQLDDVCSYGRDAAGVCLHPLVSPDDRIWLETLECTVATARPWDCLKPEAKNAAFASAGYLRVVGRQVHDPSNDLVAALKTWMNGGATDEYVDYFHCETLKGAFDGQACVDDAHCMSGFCNGGVCASPDASAPDSGLSDAGSDSSDAGPGSPDAGSHPSGAAAGDDDSGCSCRAARDTTKPTFAWLTWLVLGLLCTTRRRTRQVDVSRSDFPTAPTRRNRCSCSASVREPTPSRPRRRSPEAR